MPSRHDRFMGCMLGHLVGDAVAAPYEGMDAHLIYQMFGAAINVVKKPPVDRIYYTDDTQMSIGVAETLVREGEIIESTLVERFASNYQPQRGYGPGARKVIERMALNEDWRDLTENLFPGGSFGNGGAMRVHPVALMFNDNREKLVEQARLQCLPTHIHPLGIEGAQLLALAIAHVMRIDPGHFNRSDFIADLRAFATHDEFQWQFDTLAQLQPDDSVATFGNSLEAHRSVTTAIACFAFDSEDFEAVIARAISLGNDTDTIAAMAGAISGTYLGIDGVPAHLVDLLEDEHQGVSYVRQLAEDIYSRYAETHGDSSV